MREDFLHYVWRFKKLNSALLKTVQGNQVVVKDFGMYLGTEGPDFFNAKVFIDQQLWAGNIEMHVNASDWYVHHHEIDAAYDNVILHVVWNNDIPVVRANGEEIPTLLLKDYVSDATFRTYNQFQSDPKFIFCENYLKHFSPFEWMLWKEKLMIERLEQFSKRIFSELEQTQNNWEEAFYRLLLRSFGLNINGEAFYQLARSLPLTVLKKNQSNLMHLEALLLGTAGLLQNENEDYHLQLLQKTYQYLAHKYDLNIVVSKVSFHKLRPDNFPTIRLVQFADFFHKQLFLFDIIKNTKAGILHNNLLDSSVSEYWESHYVFGRIHKKRNKKVSKSFYELILINTILPFQYVYHQQFGKEMIEDILEHYQTIGYEKNTAVAVFKSLNVLVENALDSQALLYLKKNYCDLRRCLSCDVGIKIMNQ